MAQISIQGRAVIRFEQEPLIVTVSGEESEGVDYLLNVLHEAIVSAGESDVSQDIMNTISLQRRALIAPVKQDGRGPTRKLVIEPIKPWLTLPPGPGEIVEVPKDFRA